MMTVRVSVATLQEEVFRLTSTTSAEEKAYTRGAIDALTWLLCGSKAPSEGGSTSIPVNCVGAHNVH